ncbi:MAG: aminotransferase class V-fold PLP-dependent enzyme [Acidimicrobiaceae bacterium]|nr:aminotransferase class V-fold PLP-dependent enzyme [Acidimicrobiaceae bacterium]
MPAYLDFCSTTPVDTRVSAVVRHYMETDFGNAGSRTHEYGLIASQAVEEARSYVADGCGAKPDEVLFTSGATEANNLALLGLGQNARGTGRCHALALAIEHKAVLEPLEALAMTKGVELDLVPVGESGWVDPEDLADRLRPDTFVVSTMHANNETGVIQPLNDIAEVLQDHLAYWHVDAAQTFCKVGGLAHERIDLISLSGHKLYGPMGVGALIARRRGYERPPLSPLMFGGGQERGLRPGTVPVPLVAGLGEACRLALSEQDKRSVACAAARSKATKAFEPLEPTHNGDQNQVLPHVMNLSIPGLDAEAAMMILRDLVAISNGSACTSSSYEPSHVLSAMGLAPERASGALRVSWSHDPVLVDWVDVAERLAHALR